MRLRYAQLLAGSALSLVAICEPAVAQTNSRAPEPVAAMSDGAEIQTPVAAAASQAEKDDIVVTGSRIARAGFDAPTPTAVLGEAELRQGNRPNIAEVLNDQPQFRATISPATTAPTGNAGLAIADLRGLGTDRTLTLLNGHRFVGAGDLNTIPQGIIKRVDVVTGGASAAWGSGAVAGVVNIILDDDLEGIRVGAQTGVASRGDGARYGANLTIGKKFGDGRGHVVVATEYLKDRGIGGIGRKSRPRLESGVFQRANGDQILVHDPNSRVSNSGGAVLNATTGAPFDRIFNPDGTVSPLVLGSETVGQTTVGGNGELINDYYGVSTPSQRVNLFGRATYEFSEAAKFWIDANYTHTSANYPFFPQTFNATIAADNAFLSSSARAQLTAAGVPATFRLGRLLTDIGRPDNYQQFDISRRLLEGAIGLEGKFGNWSYNVYYNHGESRNNSRVNNTFYTSRLTRAADAVLVNGVPTCRVNANASAADDDSACVPINLFGSGNITSQAAAYSFASRQLISTTKLDAVGAALNGHFFSTWAGPVDVAVGTDFRWEEIRTNFLDPLSAAGLLSTNYSALNGGFDVKEFFGEVNVPLLNVDGTAKLEINGAARYSDYSTSGGIWSWKGGATLRLFDDLLLRAVYSRDIRSPNISELYTVRRTSFNPVIDPFRTLPGSTTPGVAQASVTSFSGGNINLDPETSHTLTLGASYSPRSVPGLSISADYYDITIDNVIATLLPQDTLNNCFGNSPSDSTCDGVITRAADGSIASIQSSFRNLAQYRTRGLDIEASYILPLSRISADMPGQLRFRAFATHLFSLDINDGIRTTDQAGIVGEASTFTQAKTRVTGTLGFEGERFGFDIRARYFGPGKWALPDFASGREILNNKVAARTYIDLNARFNIDSKFTLFANVNNVFDVDPPYISFASRIYDTIGTYFSAGATIKF